MKLSYEELSIPKVVENEARELLVVRRISVAIEM